MDKNKKYEHGRYFNDNNYRLFFIRYFYVLYPVSLKKEKCKKLPFWNFFYCFFKRNFNVGLHFTIKNKDYERR